MSMFLKPALLTVMIAFAVMVTLPLSVAKASDKMIAVDLAVDHVDITTGFNGSYLSLFGVHKGSGDVVITIKGPKREMVVRRKENVLGIWMNRANVTFDSVPAFYDFATTGPVEDMVSDKLRREYMMGIDMLKFDAPENVEAETLKVFQEALVRNKQEQGLFPIAPQNIEYIDDGFFRTSIYIPNNVPTGLYTIETYLIDNGRIKDMRHTDVKVAQVGKSAAIYNFSKSWSFIYGFLCVAFAMCVGWFSNVIRRKLS